jgi:hypothetical protein
MEMAGGFSRALQQLPRCGPHHKDTAQLAEQIDDGAGHMGLPSICNKMPLHVLLSSGVDKD